MIRTRGDSFATVSTSFTRPAVLTPTRFVTRTTAMNAAFSSAISRTSIPGIRETKYWGKATGNTAKENHSARGRPHPTRKPANAFALRDVRHATLGAFGRFELFRIPIIACDFGRTAFYSS